MFCLKHSDLKNKKNKHLECFFIMCQFFLNAKLATSAQTEVVTVY